MNKDHTHIAMVLDRSGSMQTIASDTIGGVNQFVATQKTGPGKCTITLVQFDDVIESVYENQNVKQVPPLSKETYVPRNSTALLDAIGHTIDLTGKFLEGKPEKDRPGKVICAIVTDGMENASRRQEWRAE